MAVLYVPAVCGAVWAAVLAVLHAPAVCGAVWAAVLAVLHAPAVCGAVLHGLCLTARRCHSIRHSIHLPDVRGL